MRWLALAALLFGDCESGPSNGGGTGLTRRIDRELGIVCYTNGLVDALSCVQIPRDGGSP